MLSATVSIESSCLPKQAKDSRPRGTQPDAHRVRSQNFLHPASPSSPSPGPDAGHHFNPQSLTLTGFAAVYDGLIIVFFFSSISTVYYRTIKGSQ